jgi:hypothetical protein
MGAAQHAASHKEKDVKVLRMDLSGPAWDRRFQHWTTEGRGE